MNEMTDLVKLAMFQIRQVTVYYFIYGFNC